MSVGSFLCSVLLCLVCSWGGICVLNWGGTSWKLKGELVNMRIKVEIIFCVVCGFVIIKKGEIDDALGFDVWQTHKVFDEVFECVWVYRLMVKARLWGWAYEAGRIGEGAADYGHAELDRIELSRGYLMRERRSCGEKEIKILRLIFISLKIWYCYL